MQGDRDISSSLLSAVREGRLERVEELISSFGLSYSLDWSDGYVLLRDALKNNHTEVAKLLLTNGSKVNSINENPSMTPLHFAVRNDDVEIVQMLLDRGANIDAKCEHCETPLHDAVQWEKMENIKLLLNRGADVNAEGKYGNTSLHIAAEAGYLPIVHHLLKRGADINSVCTYDGKECCSPLYLAIINEHETVVKLLLGSGANVDAQDQDGKTILYFAVEKGHSLIVEHLLKHSPDVNNAGNKSALNVAVHGLGGEYRTIVENLLQYGFNVNLEYGNNCELLHKAITEGYLKIIEEILKNGLCIHSKDIYGQTALHIATDHSNLEIVELLLKFGADIHSKDNFGRTALHIASEWYTPKNLLVYSPKLVFDYSIYPSYYSGRNNRKIVELLLKFGADIDSKNVSGKTALQIASGKGKLEIVQVLLKFGANIDSKNESGKTALQIASGMSELEIVEVLLKFGANIDSRDDDGNTALQIASANHNLKIVEVLLKHGAGIDSKDRHGKTALHIACEKCNSEAVELLLKFDAGIDSRDEDGKTALHIACEKCNSEAVELLLKFGAGIDSKDRYGKIALHYAFQCRTGDYSGYNTAIAKMIAIALLDHGSDITIMSEEYYSARWTAEILKRHAVKVQTAHLYLRNILYPYFSRDKKFRDFRNKCEKEVASMESEKVGNANISFYDILTKGISELAIYAGNESIVQVFGSNNYKLKFPIYATMINCNFRKGERRKVLMERCNEMFHFRFTNFLGILPDCTEKVFNYLSDEDLKSILNACKPISVSSPNTDNK